MVLIKTKNNYLRQLEKLLLWSDNTDDAEAVLIDCNEYFEVGLENGKTEEDIWNSLGNPSNFVKDLNLNKKWFKSIKTKALCVLLLPLLYNILLNCISSNLTSGHTTHIKSISLFSIVSILLISIGAWILLGKNSFHISYSLTTNRHILKSPIIYHSSLVLLQILTISLLTISFTLPPVYPYIGLYLSYAFYIIIFITCIVLFKSLYNFRLYSANYYPVYINAVGTIIFILYTLNWMSSLNNLNLISSFLIKGFLIYIFMLITTLSFDIYLRKKKTTTR